MHDELDDFDFEEYKSDEEDTSSSSPEDTHRTMQQQQSSVKTSVAAVKNSVDGKKNEANEGSLISFNYPVSISSELRIRF